MKLYVSPLDGGPERLVLDTDEPGISGIVRIRTDLPGAGERDHEISLSDCTDGDPHRLTLRSSQGRLVTMPVAGNTLDVRVDGALDQADRGYKSMWDRS